MKKLMFVVAICLSVVFANAQETKSTAAPATKVQSGQKMNRNMLKEAELVQPIKDNLAKDFAGYKFDKAMKLE